MPNKVVFEYGDTRIVGIDAPTKDDFRDVLHIVERRTKDALGVYRWNTLNTIEVRSVRCGEDDRHISLGAGLYVAMLDEIDSLTKALSMAKQELSQGKEQQSFEP